MKWNGKKNGMGKNFLGKKIFSDEYVAIAFQ
jgi:hypothetical protein